MNKKELVDSVASATGLDKAAAEKAVSATFDAIASELGTKDGSVTVAGFGTFERRERSARTGRNPQTGATIEIAASTVPGFKAAAALKRTVGGE